MNKKNEIKSIPEEQFVSDEVSLVENTKYYPEPVEDVVAIHNDVQVAEQTVIELPSPQYVVSNPTTAKAIQSEPVHNDGGIVLPIPANVIPNGRGRNILKARQDKPVKNV